MFNMGVGLDLRNEPHWRAQIRLAETERMSTIGGMQETQENRPWAHLGSSDS
jgi:hypothetical protein